MPLVEERRRDRRAVPSRRDGPAGAGLRGGVARRIRASSTARSRATASPVRAPSTAAHDLNYAAETGHARARGRRGRRAGAARGARRRHRRRQLSGGDQHPAGAARARAHRPRLQARHRHGRQPVHVHVLGDGRRPRRRARGRQPGKALVTGGSPRYNVYRTRDDRFVAAAPLEERFWQNFCDAIGLPAAARDDARDPEATIRAVAARIREKTADEWRAAFAGKDLCCNVVASIRGRARRSALPRRADCSRASSRRTARPITALPVPIAPEFRAERACRLSGAGRGERLLTAIPHDGAETDRS